MSPSAQTETKTLAPMLVCFAPNCGGKSKRWFDSRVQPKSDIRNIDAGPSLEFNRLIDFIGDKLSKHDMPAEMKTRDETPKSPVGKPSEKELVAKQLTKRSR